MSTRSDQDPILCAQDFNPLHYLLTNTQGFLDIQTKQAFWEAAAQQVGGTVRLGSTVDRTLNTLHLEVPHRGHKVLLEESDSRPLRLSCAVKAIDGFQFSLASRDWTDSLLYLVGLGAARTGYPELDEHYATETSPPDGLKSFLHDPDQRGFLVLNRLPLLSLQPEGPLTLLVSRTLGSAEALVALTVFFTRTLDHLEACGLIQPD